MDRYSRNIALPGIGNAGQNRLNDASVLIVGAGALGSIVGLYLAGAGVGHITVADFDTIDVSNLQRQVAFDTAQCGMSKAECLAQRMRALNPEIEVTALQKLVRASGITDAYSLVIDCADNPSTTFMIDEACLQAKIPCVIGGVEQWQGQVTSILPDPACMRWADIAPAPTCNISTPCAQKGILGPVAGVIASVMCAEAIKILTGAGKPLANKFFHYNALT